MTDTADHQALDQIEAGLSLLARGLRETCNAMLEPMGSEEQKRCFAASRELLAERRRLSA